MHCFGAQFVEVRVDAALGTVRVARYVGAFAAGRALNPKTARSQMYGGIVMGIGMALGEETHGRSRAPAAWSTPASPIISCRCNADVPEIDVMLVDEHDPYVNPLGIKGIGEMRHRRRRGGDRQRRLSRHRPARPRPAAPARDGDGLRYRHGRRAARATKLSSKLRWKSIARPDGRRPARTIPS